MTEAPKKKNRVVSVFDGSNFHICLKNMALPTRLHYTKLSIEVAKKLPKELEPWEFVRTFYVTSSPIEEDNPTAFKDWQVFQDMLSKTERLELRLGRREGARGARKEKGVDTIITTTLLAGAYQDAYDVALLFTSDGDFADAVDAVRAIGKRVFNVFHRSHRSYHLGKACTGSIELDKFDLNRFKFYQYRRY
ncbi:MAG: NYN domain-containing protein [Actinomycetota bacterium]|nr:NYN domain-containing protein [Actinomycetota bacterium]